MACRVGITTDPKGRRADWEREHPTLYDCESRVSTQRNRKRRLKRIGLPRNVAATPTREAMALKGRLGMFIFFGIGACRNLGSLSLHRRPNCECNADQNLSSRRHGHENS